MIKVRDFPGPTVLVPYGCEKEDLELAAGICALYSDAPDHVKTVTQCRTGETVCCLDISPIEKDVVKRVII